MEREIIDAIDYFVKGTGFDVKRIGVGFATISLIGDNFKLKFYAFGLEPAEVAAMIRSATYSKEMWTIDEIIKAGINICLEYHRVGWVICES